MRTESKPTDLVSALIYDPELNEFLLALQTELGVDEVRSWNYFSRTIHKEEHPIPALRRALLDELALPLAEHQYYYLQTLQSNGKSDHTQYLVLYRKENVILESHVGGQLQWVHASNLDAQHPLAEETALAINQFKSRFGSEANRLNLVHMLKLSARSS